MDFPGKLKSFVQSSLCSAMFILCIKILAIGGAQLTAHCTAVGCPETAPPECSCSSIHFTFSSVHGVAAPLMDVQYSTVFVPSMTVCVLNMTIIVSSTTISQKKSTLFVLLDKHFGSRLRIFYSKKEKHF